MINLYLEACEVLKEHGLSIDDVTVIFEGEILDKSQVKEKMNCLYDNSWGRLCFKDIQLAVDDYTWFERASYDGYEKFILKAHPLLSGFKNHESHPGSESF